MRIPDCPNCGKPLGEMEFDWFNDLVIITCDYCPTAVTAPIVLQWELMDYTTEADI